MIPEMGMGAQPLNVLTEGLTDDDGVFSSKTKKSSLVKSHV